MIDFFLFAALSLFVIINPFSSIPAFLSITPDDTAAERISAARKASVIAGIILILFAAAGHYLFKFLGLTISAVQISGGILLFIIALDMMRSPDMKARLNPVEKEIAKEKEDITVTPMAMPLLCGPGAISTVVILQSQAESWEYNVALLAAIPLVYAKINN